MTSNTVHLETHDNEMPSAEMEVPKVEVVARCRHSVCGAHIAVDPDGCQWIFKPTHLEGRTECGEAMKRGVEWGDTTKKELAAFALGSKVGVPQTLIGVAQIDGKPATGSLQYFVQSQGCADDYGASKFLDDDVQMIAVLDIRLLQLDRHEGNILVSKDGGGALRLIPIDHGYCLPSYRDTSDVFYSWQYWPGAKAPVTDGVRKFVNELNPVSSGRTLRRLGIRHESIITSALSTTLLKREVARNHTLHHVANLLAAPDMDSTSVFQRALNGLQVEVDEDDLWPWSETRNGEHSQSHQDSRRRWSALQKQFLEAVDKCVAADETTESISAPRPPSSRPIIPTGDLPPPLCLLPTTPKAIVKKKADPPPLMLSAGFMLDADMSSSFAEHPLSPSIFSLSAIYDTPIYQQTPVI